MTWKYTPFAIPLLVAAIIAVALTIFAWRRRGTTGARAFVLLMAAVSLWLIEYAVEVGLMEQSRRLFWTDLQFFSIAIIPIAWLIFTAQYTSFDRWLNRRNVLLLFIVPTISWTLLWTNSSHMLFRRVVFLDLSGAYPIWSNTLGPAFWVHAGYSYLLLLVGTVFLVRAYARRSRIYRRQIQVMLLGALAPWLTNFVYLMILDSQMVLDPTPFAFLVTGIMLAWGMFGFQLIDLTPIAYSSVVKRMQEGMIVLDGQNRIVGINPAACEIIEQAEEEVVGQPAAKVFARWSEWFDAFRDVYATNTEIAVTDRGETFHYQLTIAPLQDPQQAQSARVLVIHDITAQKEAEAALRNAKEAAESANRARSTFLATMSHELRTPLTAIIGYSELVQEESEDLGCPDVNPYMSKIETAANHLLTVINDILSISQIEAGYTELHCNRFSLHDLVETTVLRIQPDIDRSGNEFLVSLAQPQTVMFNDQGKLHEILHCLLHNASKFTEGGQIELDVDVLHDANTPKEEQSVRIRVSDTGPGIPPDKLTYIFQPFVQADSTTTRKHQGTGLGLAIAHHYARMMQGDITVHSEVGAGTIFTVTLPLICAGAETAVEDSAV